MALAVLFETFNLLQIGHRMDQGSAGLQYESGCSILELDSGSTMQLDLSFDGISFGIAFGMSQAGFFMLVLSSG